MAALLSVGTAKTPSQVSASHHANLGMTAGNVETRTSMATVPNGANIVLVRGGYRGG